MSSPLPFIATNEPTGLAYSHERCIAAYMSRAMGFYRPSHLDRAVGMIFKTIGFKPHGLPCRLASRAAFGLMQRRRRRFLSVVT